MQALEEVLARGLGVTPGAELELASGFDPAGGIDDEIGPVSPLGEVAGRPSLHHVVARDVGALFGPKRSYDDRPGPHRLTALGAVGLGGIVDMDRRREVARRMGAPNLADAIWLKGEGEAAIASQVKTPKHGVMPAWLPRLGDPSVKQLAIFVHSLGGGE